MKNLTSTKASLFSISFVIGFALSGFAQNNKIYITDSTFTEGIRISHEKENSCWNNKTVKADSNQVKLYFDSRKNSCITGDVNGIYHAKWNGGNWEKTESINAQNKSSLHSDSTIICNSIPLELMSYKIQKKGINIDINWSTAQEKQNDYFVIERSTNNKDFETIAKIQGVGNTGNLNNYHFTDKAPKEGINFYRLKHMDEHNECSYPEIKAVYVNRKEDQNTKLYIDELDGDAKFSYLSRSGENFQIKIVGQTGKVLFEGFIPSLDGTTIVNLDFAKFTNQVYFIYLIDPNGNITVLQYDDNIK